MNKKLAAAVFLMLAVTLFIAAGCGTGQNKQVGTVAVVKVDKGSLDDGSTVSGKLEAVASANVVSKMPGKVAAISVDIGSKVSAGDVLVRLEADELQAAVQLAEANVKLARDNYQKAKDADLLAKNQAQAAVASAETTYKNAQADYQRMKDLLEQGAISQQAFDQAEKAFLLAQSAYNSAEKNQQIVESDTVPDSIQVAEAQLEQARANYANSIITSPISGVVTAKNVNKGELASPSVPVVTIVNLEQVLVRANVDEKLVNSLKAGQTVPVKISAVSDKPFNGVITNISAAADPATKAYPIKVQINNNDHKLKPGMFAEIKFGSSTGRQLLVPRQAIFNSENNSYVYVVEAGKAVKRKVEPGRSDGKNVVINSGLKRGEKVVASGVESLHSGMKVEVGS